MDTLVFRPEPFGMPRAQRGGCGCRACRQHDELEVHDAPDEPSFELDDDEREFEADDQEWDPEWDVTDPRKHCSEGTPLEVKECGSMPEQKPIQCHPNMTKTCPRLPETWRSKTIAGVPFFYGPTIRRVGGKQFHITNDGENRRVNIVPSAWRAAHGWITAMNTLFGMKITAVYTMGQGRYCRCVRKPAGVCRESKREDWHKCIGTTISDHGYGDALDVIGVRWADKTAVGSALDTTIIHSWRDPQQAELLIRINAALRIHFNTVLDYSRPDHQDHFHCDMNQGRVRPVVFGKGRSEPNFIMTSLKKLKYLDSPTPVDWPRARSALAAFAGVVNMPVPSDPNAGRAWRPIVQRLYGCVALGVAGQCARP